MCVLLCNRIGSRKLTREEFNNWWNTNPHGFWVMYSDGEKLIVYKSMDLNESFTLYEKAYEEAKWGNVVSHFRMATHGVKTIDNVHPFYCGKDEYGGDMMLAHNGIIQYDAKSIWEKSDTRLFAEWLSTFPNGYEKMDEYKYLINSYLTWDKVIIMNSRGEPHYFGSVGMEMDGDIWASNGSCKVYSIFNKLPSLLQKSNPITPPSEGAAKVPVAWTFVGIPSISDETKIPWSVYSINSWQLHCTWYFIDKHGYARHYTNK